MGTWNTALTKENLKQRVNTYFLHRGLPYQFEDMIRLKEMRIGHKHIPMSQQADALEIPVRTLYNWHKLHDS